MNANKHEWLYHRIVIGMWFLLAFIRIPVRYIITVQEVMSGTITVFLPIPRWENLTRDFEVPSHIRRHQFNSEKFHFSGLLPNPALAFPFMFYKKGPCEEGKQVIRFGIQYRLTLFWAVERSSDSSLLPDLRATDERNPVLDLQRISWINDSVLYFEYDTALWDSLREYWMHFYCG